MSTDPFGDGYFDNPQQPTIHLTDDDIGKQFITREGTVIVLHGKTDPSYLYAKTHPYKCDNGITVKPNGRSNVSESLSGADIVARVDEHDGSQQSTIHLTDDDIGKQFVTRGGAEVTLKRNSTGSKFYRSHPFAHSYGSVRADGTYCLGDHVSNCFHDIVARVGPRDGSPVRRRTFASGMVRDTTKGKTQWHRLFDGPMARRYAEHLTKGADHYPDVAPGKPNWTLAEGEEELARANESLARHFAQLVTGETDEDHAAAVWFNVNLREHILEKMAAARATA